MSKNYSGTVLERLETRRLMSGGGAVRPSQAYTQLLSQANVQTILANAASQATDGQVITVTDRDGHILGMVVKGQIADPTLEALRKIKSIDQAVTAAFFESTQDAFTTRTARFIIQDHFPFPLRNTAGGPLYGVEFSSQPGSDILSSVPFAGINGTALAISGDPGAVPLFIGGVPVGGIGVSGDGNDKAVRSDIRLHGDTDTTTASYDGTEEHSFNEAVALAGAQGFMAPHSIQADQIYIGGLKFPYLVDSPAHLQPPQSYASLIGSGTVTQTPFTNPISGLIMYDGGIHDGVRAFQPTVFDKTVGELRNPIIDGAAASDGSHLTQADVTSIIHNALRKALHTRAAIREPIGVNAIVHICVVDLQGNPIGSFRMNDGTNFSYDVAVQKARTANFFSSDTAAFSSRAIGFMAQKDFPAGINESRQGPLYHIQNDMSGLPAEGLFATIPDVPTFTKPASLTKNGITTFPGGFPLYKNGKLVGAIGVSGDGVDQDDTIGYAGTANYRPSFKFVSSHLGDAQIQAAFDPKLMFLEANQIVDATLIEKSRASFRRGLDHVRLPYVKFPRNPDV